MKFFILLIFPFIMFSQEKHGNEGFLFQTTKVTDIDSLTFKFEYANFIFVPQKKISNHFIYKIKKRINEGKSFLNILSKKGFLYDLIDISYNENRMKKVYDSLEVEKILGRKNNTCFDNNVFNVYQNDNKISKISFSGVFKEINILDYLKIFPEDDLFKNIEVSEIKIINNNSNIIKVNKKMCRRRVWVNHNSSLLAKTLLVYDCQIK